MYKKFHIIVHLFIALIFLFIFSRNLSSEEYFQTRKIENKVFKAGERFQYRVKWEFIDVGYSVLEIKKVLKMNNRDVFHVRLEANSNSIVDTIFKIRDSLETYIDTDGIFPWKFRKTVNEGTKHYERETIFDQLNYKAYYKGREITIPLYAQDVLSVFYYARVFDLKKCFIIHFDVHNEGKNYLASARFIDIENIKVEAGNFETINIEISWWKENGRKESYKMWLTDDARKIIVRLEGKTKIGRFIMTLKEYNL